MKIWYTKLFVRGWEDKIWKNSKAFFLNGLDINSLFRSISKYKDVNNSQKDIFNIAGGNRKETFLKQLLSQ